MICSVSVKRTFLYGHPLILNVIEHSPKLKIIQHMSGILGCMAIYKISLNRMQLSIRLILEIF